MRLQGVFLVASAGLCLARTCLLRSSSSLDTATSTLTSATATTTSAPTTTSATIPATTTSTDSATTTSTVTVAPPSTENRLIDGNFDNGNDLSAWQTAIIPASDTTASLSLVAGEASAQSAPQYVYLDTKQAGTSFSLCQPINLVSMYHYDFSAYVHYICRDVNNANCQGSDYVSVTFALGEVVSEPQSASNSDYALVTSKLFYDGASGDGILACVTVSVSSQPISDVNIYLDTLSVNANLGSGSEMNRI